MACIDLLKNNNGFNENTRQSLLSNISLPVYLHFLDRELLSVFNAYGNISTRNIVSDIKRILLFTYEPLYISTSLVFENYYARYLFDNFSELFRLGHIELIIGEESMSDFIYVKKSQYSHAKDNYPFYFDDSWKKIASIGPDFCSKPQGFNTGNFLEKNLTFDLMQNGCENTARRLNFDLNTLSLQEYTPYIVESIINRGNKAVTKLLFQNCYNRFDLSRIEKRIYNLKISEFYIQAYLTQFSGTLATGLSSNIEYFSYLCSTYPFHDIRLWRHIYQKTIGLQVINRLSVSEIVKIRESIPYLFYIDEVRLFLFRAIEKYYDYISSKLGEIEPSDLQQFDMINYLLRLVRSSLGFHKTEPKGFCELLRCFEDSGNRISEISLNENNMRRSYSGLTLANKGDKMKRNVFVIYGRNQKLREAIFTFLRAANLKPLEWDQAVKLSNSPTPYIGNVIDKALENAQGIIVLFTGDDLAKLDDKYLDPNEEPEDLSPQPRPNVLYETGMAFGKAPERTVVVQIGNIRSISDLSGLHVVKLDNTTQKRKSLLVRLIGIGCDVDMTGDDWMSAGDFSQ